nr:hypothetical protein CFP56_20410 [Quercus suber]
MSVKSIWEQCENASTQQEVHRDDAANCRVGMPNPPEVCRGGIDRRSLSLVSSIDLHSGAMIDFHVGRAKGGRAMISSTNGSRVSVTSRGHNSLSFTDLLHALIFLRSWNRECPLCYSARDQRLPEHFVVFSNCDGPYAFKECRFRSTGTPGAFVVHSECLALIQGRTNMEDYIHILQNLRRLAVTLQYAWAIPERYRNLRSQAISMKAAYTQTHQLLTSTTPLTKTLTYVLKLPVEMQAQIFEMY